MAGKTNLDAITDFPGLLAYLEDELDWPIDAATFEEATFEYTAAELGLKEDVVGGAVEIKQLRPLVSGQPWGVFFLNLPHKRLPQTIVRNILGRLTVKKRAASNDPGRPAFLKSDLLFITSTGAGEERRLAFAHFQDDPKGGNAATLKVLGWDEFDTPRRLKLTEGTLAEKLHWPDNPADVAKWRKQWAEAFSRHDTRTVVRDSITMAKALAALARRIRARAAELIAAQTGEGSLVKLHAAFKEALIHDLTPQGFADTYAQTIAYGLLSTAISRASGALTQDDMTANVAGTSPFLKEMLGTFIEAGGRRGGNANANLDFDELGVAEVVELLRNADMEAVLADFDRKNPDEDPVIHFYELFLKEYDSAQKVKRGVFYTPRPVVGFIVRSVDEVLRTEFGLPDGLAATETWRHVIAAKPEIKLPTGAKLDDPFVRILDPATGTGTFLVECVDLIHKTMLAKWKAAGKREAEIKVLWNDYVPRHLLPRLTGFELMMAPYAIAHVKLGLKLSDTGYRFGSDARAQIYLTNALEPAQDLDMQMIFMSEALAHEALAANGAKGTCFTAVLGNPPYSGHSANNNIPSIVRKVHDYKKDWPDLLKPGQSKWLQDDYVKFIRFAQEKLVTSGHGVLGFITNDGWLENPTFKGMRQILCSTFSRLDVLDFHGNYKLGQSPDGSADENLFEGVAQGVSVTIASTHCMVLDRGVRRFDMYGSEISKLKWLAGRDVSDVTFVGCDVLPPENLFVALDSSTRSEFRAFPRVRDAMDRNGDPAPGIVTTHDEFAVSFDAKEQIEKVQTLLETPDEATARTIFRLCTQSQWNYNLAKRSLSSGSWRSELKPILYRPFDERVTVYNSHIAVHRRKRASDNMFLLSNVGLIIPRACEIQRGWEHVWCSNMLIQHHTVSIKEINYLFPLWLKPEGTETRTLPNIAPDFAKRVSKLTNLTWDDCIDSPKQSALAGIVSPKPTQQALFEDRKERGDLKTSFGPRDLFDWIYAVLHSPAYRARYADYLKSDFARIPLPKDRAIFKALVPYGTMLVALHLLDTKVAPGLIDPKSIRLAGSGDNRVTGKSADFENDSWTGGRMYISPSQWFETVPERVANFHIGGYRPARKWLKDRTASGGKRPSPGRVLTPEDILHYRRMIVAMDKTIDIMALIDTEIEKHGGWPDAFRGMTD